MFQNGYILVRIRILGSMPPIDDPVPDPHPALFISDLQGYKMPKKIVSFFAYYFLMYIYVILHR
jgi:hypothetical protein